MPDNTDSRLESESIGEDPTSVTAAETEFERQARAERELAESASERTGEDIQRSDVELQSGGPVFSPRAQRAFEERRKERIVAELQGQTQTELTPEDIVLGQDGAELTEDAKKEEGLEDLQDETQLDLTTADIQLSESGQIQLKEEAKKQEAAQSLQNQTQTDVSPEDIVLGQDGPQLTEEAKREEAASELDQQYAVDITPDDVQRQDGGWTLAGDVTSEIKKQRAVQSLQGQTKIDVDPSDVAISDGAASLKKGARRLEKRKRALEQFRNQTTADDLISLSDVKLGEGSGAQPYLSQYTRIQLGRHAEDVQAVQVEADLENQLGVEDLERGEDFTIEDDDVTVSRDVLDDNLLSDVQSIGDYNLSIEERTTDTDVDTEVEADQEFDDRTVITPAEDFASISEEDTTRETGQRLYRRQYGTEDLEIDFTGDTAEEAINKVSAITGLREYQARAPDSDAVLSEEVRSALQREQAARTATQETEGAFVASDVNVDSDTGEIEITDPRQERSLLRLRQDEAEQRLLDQLNDPTQTLFEGREQPLGEDYNFGPNALEVGVSQGTYDVSLSESARETIRETEREERRQMIEEREEQQAEERIGRGVLLGRQAAEATEDSVVSFLRQTKGVDDREDVEIADGKIQLSEQGEASMKESVAADIGGKYGVPVSTEDIIRTDEGFELTEEAREEVGEQYSQQQAAVLIQGTTERQRERLERLSALTTARQVSRGRMLQSARERAIDSLEADIFGPFAALEGEGLNAGDVTVTQTDDDNLRASLSEEKQEEVEASYEESLVRDIEEQTGTELTRDDITIEETDEGYRATLSESGKRKVEIEKTPGEGLPIIGGVTTTGTRIRRGIRSRTDPFAERWREVTPSKEDVYGLVGATAPIAAAEPTPIGETGLAIIAGTGLSAAALQRRGNVLTGDDPSVSATTRLPTTTATVGIGDTYEIDELLPGESPQDRAELEVGETDGSELPTPQTPDVDGSELSVGETDVSELTVPSQRETSLSILRTDPAQIGELREEVEDEETDVEITEDDIITGLPKPDQPGPSTRERQRREDLTTPERTFPTGSSAVVGEQGVTEDVEQRVEEAEQPFERTQTEVDGTTETLTEGQADVPEVGFAGSREAEEQKQAQEQAQAPFTDRDAYQQPSISPYQDTRLGQGAMQALDARQRAALRVEQATRLGMNPLEATETGAQARQAQYQQPLAMQQNAQLLEETTDETGELTENRVAQPTQYAVENQAVYEYPTATTPPVNTPREGITPLGNIGAQTDEGDGDESRQVQTILTSFRNPLTGGITETTEDPTDEITLPQIDLNR